MIDESVVASGLVNHVQFLFWHTAQARSRLSFTPPLVWLAKSAVHVAGMAIAARLRAVKDSSSSSRTPARLASRRGAAVAPIVHVCGGAAQLSVSAPTLHASSSNARLKHKHAGAGPARGPHTRAGACVAVGRARSGRELKSTGGWGRQHAHGGARDRCKRGVAHTFCAAASARGPSSRPVAAGGAGDTRQCGAQRVR